LTLGTELPDSPLPSNQRGAQKWGFTPPQRHCLNGRESKSPGEFGERSPGRKIPVGHPSCTLLKPEGRCSKEGQSFGKGAEKGRWTIKTAKNKVGGRHWPENEAVEMMNPKKRASNRGMLDPREKKVAKGGIGGAVGGSILINSFSINHP